MRHSALPVILACVLTGGCDLFNTKDDTPDNPTSPTSPTANLETFAGTWSSTSATIPATACGNVTYTVTPVNTTTANVTFAATCAETIQVSGTGTGKVSGSTLDWSAQGLVGQGGVNCPFSFTNGKAVEEPGGGIKITYTGTVCGIPVSGTEIVKK
jgi:hypothetical protein